MSSISAHIGTQFGLVLILVLSGCGSPASKEGKTPAYQPEKVVEKPARPNAKPAGPAFRPVDRMFGKVVLVNAKLRYVVIDFTGSQLPEANRRLALYRNGQQVAEIRISGQPRYSNLSADIMSGEAQAGDEAVEP